MNSSGDSLIRIHEDFTVLFALDKTNRQPAAQLSMGSFITNASFVPGAYHMQFSFRHGSFQSKQQPIVEKSWLIQSILITDQGVGHTAQVKQAILVSVVSGDSGDLN